jgi:hypothetical protein
MTFEYLRTVFSNDTIGTGTLLFISGETTAYSELKGESTDTVLTYLGEQEWELVSSYVQPISCVVNLIFKRAKKQVGTGGEVSYSARIY